MSLLEQPRLALTRLNRLGRNIFTLNRDREYAALLRMLNLVPTDKLLDVGSGDGFWTSRFSKHCEYVVGLDPSEQSVEFADLFHSKTNIHYTCDVAESLPFLDEVFDKVVQSILSVKTNKNAVVMFDNSIRTDIYNILITNIKGSEIITTLMDQLIKNIDDDNINARIIQYASEAENNLIHGRRDIIHIDYFISGVMRELMNYNIPKNGNNGGKKAINV